MSTQEADPEGPFGDPQYRGNLVGLHLLEVPHGEHLAVMPGHAQQGLMHPLPLLDADRAASGPIVPRVH